MEKKVSEVQELRLKKAKIPMRVRVAAVITRGKEILLVKHQKGDKCYWLLPGGGVEPGEPLHDALKREIREECGMECKVGPLLYIVDSISPEKEKHILNIIFQSTPVEQRIEPKSSDSAIVEIKYTTVGLLKEITLHPPINKELISDLTDGFIGAKYLGALWKEL